MNKKDNIDKLARLLFTQACIENKTAVSEAHCPAFEKQTLEVQELFLSKAKEYIRQVEAGMELARDEQHLRDIVTKTVAKLGNESLVGPMEIGFMTAVSMECNKTLPSYLIKQFLDADKMLFMYYAGLSVKQAAKMFCDFLANIQDKVAALKDTPPT